MRISWPLETRKPWAVCVKDWAGWAYRSVTHPEARPGPDDLGALLAAIPFSSDRAVLAPYRGFRAIRLRQSAEDHAIGNVVAGVGLPALVLERHLDGKPGCPADEGLRDPQAWRPLPAVL